MDGESTKTPSADEHCWGAGWGLGVQVRGVYDGILYYVCPRCDYAWHTMPPDDLLYELARKYVIEHNEPRMVAKLDSRGRPA